MSATAAAASSESPVWSEETFPSKDGTKLFRCSLVPANAKATVAIIHGYADHCGRYKDVMEALARAGYAAHAFDYRGHGKAEGRRGFCAKFDDFLDDMLAFLAKVQAEAKGSLFLFPHSHGGLITATLLVSERAPKNVAGAIFSAPYFRLRIEPSRFQLFQAKWVGKVAPWLPIKNPLTEQQLSRDVAFQKLTAADPLRHHVVTPRWFTESTAAQERLRETWSNVTLPILVMQGDADPVVVPAESKKFHDAARSTDKKFVSWPGSLHEILNDLDKEKVVAEAVSWLDAHAGAKA